MEMKRYDDPGLNVAPEWTDCLKGYLVQLFGRPTPLRSLGRLGSREPDRGTPAPCTLQ